MKQEYNFETMEGKQNPYAEKLKKQITMNIDVDTVQYFKALSKQNGIPYQTLINLYLRDCVEHHRELQFQWE